MWKFVRKSMKGLAIFVALLAFGGGSAAADTQMILGGKFDLRNPNDAKPQRRGFFLFAREEPVSPNLVIGDPTVHGATLRIIARGETAVYDETLELPAAGWKATLSRHDWPVYKGFRYTNKEVGGPVKLIVIRRAGFATPEGQPLPETPRPEEFRLMIRLVGRDGIIPVLPPNPGTDGGVVLTLGGGDSYCVGYGADAGGKIRSNSEKRFSIRRPEVEGCPGDVVPPSTISTTTTSTTTSTTDP